MDTGYVMDTDLETRAAVDSPPPPLAILDLAHLRIYTAGDLAFEAEILGLFLAELPKTMALLARAETPAAWHMAAHTLKGSALGIGARRLAAEARIAESYAFPAAAERRVLMAGLRGAIREVDSEINRLGLLNAAAP